MLQNQSWMKRTGSALLEFDPELNKLSKDKALRDGLSVVVQIGDTLWVANDETISLERLSCLSSNRDGDHKYGEHTQFPLNDFLQLPVPPPSDPAERLQIEEADLEGLDYEDGYLWLVGSHSLKRKKPDENESVKDNVERLAKVGRDGNRFLLARIPVAEKDGTYTLEKKFNNRTAAQLRGDDKSNDLTDALASDKHLRASLSIPGKDNGFDIEGLAVVGDRIFIGLRGPVLRGWAVILEVEPKEDEGNVSKLRLKKIGRDDRPCRKHLLQLGGLGIRDLCVHGSDLLILAGPTMDLDGPVTVFRWPGGTDPEEESLIFADRLPILLQVPYGTGEHKGKDHAEGMTLFASGGGHARSVLVVYDSASKERLKETNSVEADIFDFP
jgi:Protein of unknown function (DUF3616)